MLSPFKPTLTGKKFVKLTILKVMSNKARGREERVIEN